MRQPALWHKLLATGLLGAHRSRPALRLRRPAPRGSWHVARRQDRCRETLTGERVAASGRSPGIICLAFMEGVMKGRFKVILIIASRTHLDVCVPVADEPHHLIHDCLPCLHGRKKRPCRCVWHPRLRRPTALHRLCNSRSMPDVSRCRSCHQESRNSSATRTPTSLWSCIASSSDACVDCGHTGERCT